MPKPGIALSYIVINSRGHLMRSSDHFSHNLWHHSMLQGINQKIDSSFSDASWIGHGNSMLRPYVNIGTRACFGESLLDRSIYGQIGSNIRNEPHYTRSNLAFTEQRIGRTRERHEDCLSYNCDAFQTQSSSTVPSLWHGKERTKCCNYTPNPATPNSKWRIDGSEKQSTGKRKALEHDDLNLSLSLGSKLRKEEVRRKLWGDEEEVESNLLLSLSSSLTREICTSTNLKRYGRLNEGDDTINPKSASTLDLTI